MGTVCQLQKAKNTLSQLIKQAANGDAQVVTVHGKPAAVVARRKNTPGLPGNGASSQARSCVPTLPLTTSIFPALFLKDVSQGR